MPFYSRIPAAPRTSRRNGSGGVIRWDARCSQPPCIPGPSTLPSTPGADLLTLKCDPVWSEQLRAEHPGHPARLLLRQTQLDIGRRRRRRARRSALRAVRPFVPPRVRQTDEEGPTRDRRVTAAGARRRSPFRLRLHRSRPLLPVLPRRSIARCLHCPLLPLLPGPSPAARTVPCCPCCLHRSPAPSRLTTLAVSRIVCSQAA